MTPTPNPQGTLGSSEAAAFICLANIYTALTPVLHC